MRGLVAALSIGALLAGQAGPAAAQVRQAGVRPADNTDEGGLWVASDKAELQAKASAELNRDPALNAYVKGALCKTAVEYCDDVRIYVLDRPYFNASMAPNGYGEVWSGLLLRAETEDELAFVLGHEVSHYAENHSLESWRAAKNRMTGAMILSIGVGIAGAAAGAGAATASAARTASDVASVVSNVIYLGAVASLFSFSRDHEHEADRLAYRRAVKAGYGSDAGPRLWRAIQAETAASQFPKVRRSESRINIFNSHPVTTDRIKALETLGAGKAPSAADARARHRAAIRPHLAAWIRDDLRRKDFGQTLHVLGRLDDGGEDLGLLGFYKGEAFRLRRDKGDAALARAAYEAAVAHPDVPAPAWRELGEARRKAGDGAGARTAFTTYLERAPTADDKWLVEATLAKLP